MSTVFLLVPVALLVLFALERRFPLRRARRPLFDRLRVNLLIGVLAVASAAVLVKPVAGTVLEWESERGFGLVPMLPMPPFAHWIATFLLLDLAFYYWHRANHAWPLLWRFHNAHHVDPDLDVSTSFRFHFVEIAFSAGFRVVQIASIGGPVWAFAAYELAFQVNTLFQHSNVRLPIGVERWLSLVIVTPRMHGIHHSQMRAETDSNWSSVLSCWDRLHGTLRLNVPQVDIEIGVPGYAQPDDNRAARVLAMPFEAQRDYWHASEGPRAKRADENSDRRRLAA